VGLGLFIVREIARAHRGEVRVVSDAEQGTTFTVTMPAR
jgi:phosphoserine phosphatase RsbU/P